MYQSVDPKKSLPNIEEEVLKYWQKEKTFEKVQDLRKDAPLFVFFEGPPTANAKPAMHHVEARAFKDLIPRYQTMRGKRVDRKAGWDTQGLPVELQVEKKLGLKNKKEIEAYGIDKFNAECKKDVWSNIADWKNLTERIGFWLDLDHPYITYENEYIESVWAIIKHVSEQKDALQQPMLYLGHKVVPYCTRCGTALSSHEVAQGYRSVTEPSIYVKFKLANKAKSELGDRFTNYELRITEETSIYILAWTTTPWTLPGNVALAVGDDIKYVVAETKSGEIYILAEDRLEILNDVPHKVLFATKGSDLVGLEYEPLFPGVIKANNQAFKVYAADFVTTTDGTGVVHTAVMYGEDDYELGTKVGLPKQHSVGEDGRFLPSLKEFGLAGMYVKDKKAEELIIDLLKSKNLLLNIVDYSHDYPFCWRCDTPLLYYARDSWFIRMSALKDELIKRNNTVKWEPATIKTGRMGEWLENVKDWAISRDRYWGTPLPIWVCPNKHVTVVGSVKELEDLLFRSSSGLPRGSQEETMDSRVRGNDNIKSIPGDLHRPYIDEVTFDCPECGKTSKRTPEVADVWLDSGSMPFAQWGYPHIAGSEKELETHYPADYISEAIDQTRGWFYTLLAVATLMGKESPYKNVICLGHLLDEHGKKMSKSKGNVVDPWAMINKYGADATRFYFYSVNAPGDPKLFSEKDLQAIQRRVLMIWWNVYSYFVTYSNENGWSYPKDSHDYRESPNVLDKWILARLNLTIETVTKSLDKYDVLSASRSLMDLIDELSTWYLRRSRSRFGDQNNTQDRHFAFATLFHTLIHLTKLMAPFTPFISEAIFTNLTGTSVHLSDWSEAEPIDKKVLDDMKTVREVVSAGLEARMQAGVKVRQKLGNLAVVDKSNVLKDRSEYLELIKDEVNVAEVLVLSTSDFPNYPNYPNIVKTWVKSTTASFQVYLNPEITPELEGDGMLRELIRAIQDWRKSNGLTVADRIKVRWRSDDEGIVKILGDEEKLASLLASTKSQIEKSTVVDKESLKIDLNGHEIILGIEKINQVR